MNTKAQPEIRRVLVLSTIHITPETLNDFKEWPQICSFDEGAYFCVGDEWDDEDDLNHPCPLDLIRVLQFAHDLDCQEVKFDCDAYEVEGLPKYEEEWQ